MHDHLHDNSGKLFDPSEIPDSGYELGKTETVSLDLKGSFERNPDGKVREPSGEESYYTRLAQLRVGGNKTFEDIDIISLSAPGTQFDLAHNSSKVEFQHYYATDLKVHKLFCMVTFVALATATKA